MDEKHYYSLLGVTKQISDEELKKVYHQMVKKYHPDRNPDDPNAVKKFKEIAEAYRVLIEIRSKKTDRFSKVKNIFTGVVKTQSQQQEDKSQNNQEYHGEKKPEKGKDINTEVDVTFMQSLTGCKKAIEINRLRHCRCCYDGRPSVGCVMCNGTGKVTKTTVLELNIPRRVQDGQMLKIVGKGHVGDIGASDGDISIRINVKPNENYMVKGNDVYYRLLLTFPEAVLGTQRTIQTVQGLVECSIPEGVQAGTKIRLKGKGMADEETGQLGDLYIIIMIHIPTADTEYKKVLMHKIQQIMYESTS